ncbi:hypothetical protein [Nonomuraea sp. NPDC003201]
MVTPRGNWREVVALIASLSPLAGFLFATAAFGNEPAVLGALAAVLLSGLAAALPIAAVLSRRRGGSTT